jgi:hypothetical protein
MEVVGSRYFLKLVKKKIFFILFFLKKKRNMPFFTQKVFLIKKNSNIENKINISMQGIKKFNKNFFL